MAVLDSSLKCPKCGGDNFVVKKCTLLERLMIFVSRKRKYRCWNCSHAFRYSFGTASESESGFQINRGKGKIMGASKMLTELRRERESIEEAILALERLQNERAKRRGRPSGGMANLKTQQEAADSQSRARRKPARGRPGK
jgi:predicted nucleic-acid-binding Zn-ribbon protein